METMLDPFLGKVLADKYRIDSVMRATELGNVYHATHLLMEKPVVVKVLAPALAIDEQIVKDFSSEARSLSSVSHPNILNVTDFGSDANGAVYIVYEDADGVTLREAIITGGPLEAGDMMRISKQVALALSAAHAKGLVHGRLSSDSILLGEENAVKVLDFGTQRPDAIADDEDREGVEYLSPEQCVDAASADARSDIYSAGVVMFEMLAGEVPFKGEATADLMLKHAQEPPPPLAAFRHDLPPNIEPLILQALAKNPEMRHQSAAELFDDLNRVERGLAFSDADAATAAAAAGGGLGGGNNVWKTAFVVLAGIAILSVFMIWATSSKSTNPSTMQADANSMPVQPINPASGQNEQSLASMIPSSTSDMSFNSNMPVTMPDPVPGGDGYNPWANGVQPPSGAPGYVPPGQYVDPNNPGSIFNQDAPGTTAGGQIIKGPDGNYYYVVPDANGANSNVAPKATPKPGKSPNANVAVEPTPAVTDTPKPTDKATPAPTPATTPAATPKPTDKTKPADKPKPATTKTPTSGKTQDS